MAGAEALGERHKQAPGPLWHVWSCLNDERTVTVGAPCLAAVLVLASLGILVGNRVTEIGYEGTQYCFSTFFFPEVGLDISGSDEESCLGSVDLVNGPLLETPCDQRTGFGAGTAAVLTFLVFALLLTIPILVFTGYEVSGELPIAETTPDQRWALFMVLLTYMLLFVAVSTALTIGSASYISTTVCFDLLLNLIETELGTVARSACESASSIATTLFAMSWALFGISLLLLIMWVSLVCHRRHWYHTVAWDPKQELARLGDLD